MAKNTKSTPAPTATAPTATAPTATAPTSNAPVIATVTIAPAAPVAPKQRGRPKRADGQPAMSSFVNVSLSDLEKLVGTSGFVRVSRTWLKELNVTITPVAAPVVAAGSDAGDASATPFPVS